MSAGICIDADEFCNDFYVELDRQGDDIYALTGYEYGCSLDDRTATGTLRLAGGEYFGHLNTAEYGRWTFEFDAETLDGLVSVVYIRTLPDGSVYSTQSASHLVVSACPDPAETPGLASPRAPDALAP